MFVVNDPDETRSCVIHVKRIWFFFHNLWTFELHSNAVSVAHHLVSSVDICDHEVISICFKHLDLVALGGRWSLLKSMHISCSRMELPKLWMRSKQTWPLGKQRNTYTLPYVVCPELESLVFLTAYEGKYIIKPTQTKGALSSIIVKKNSFAQ